MIKKFSLKIRNGEVFFCNLGLNACTPESFAVAELGTTPSEVFARVTAHDALEHGPSQTRLTAVSFIEEFRALGAMRFTRPNIPLDGDLHILMEYLQGDLSKLYPLSPVRDAAEGEFSLDTITAGLRGKHVDLMGINPADAAAAIKRHLEYGYWVVGRQYIDSADAQSAFHELAHQLEHEFDNLQDAYYEECKNHCSVTFDTCSYATTFRYSTRNV